MEKEKDLEVVEETDMISVAKEANQLISSKDKEIESLKVKLARAELYKEVPKEEPVNTFDPTVKFDPRGRSNLDVAKHIVNVHDYNRTNNRKSPLAIDQAQADQIATFYKTVIDKSNDDPQEFLYHYKRTLGNDKPESKQLYDKFVAFNNINR